MRSFGSRGLGISSEQERERLAKMTPEQRSAECRRVGNICALIAVLMYVVGVISLLLNKLVEDALLVTTVCLILLGASALAAHIEYMKARKEDRLAMSLDKSS